METATPGPGKEAMKGIQALLDAKPVKIRGQDENVFFTQYQLHGFKTWVRPKEQCPLFPKSEREARHYALSLLLQELG